MQRKQADGRVCTSIALAIFCLIRYKGAESRYLSCSSRCFPIRMFVCWMDRSDGLAISSQENLFFFSLDIDRSVIDFDLSHSRHLTFIYHSTKFAMRDEIFN